MKRWPLNDRVKENSDIARRAKLSHPLGRALALENRIQMNGEIIFRWRQGDSFRKQVNHLTAMKDFRVSTAQHWLKAWKDGKHIRNSQLTIEDYNKRRRAYCAEYKQRAEEAKKSWEKTLEILRSGHESDHAFEPGEGYPARMYCITCGGSETDHR